MSMMSAALLGFSLLGGVTDACQSVQSCNDLGTAAYQKNQLRAAIEAFETQADYAESEDTFDARAVAYNNLALAWNKQGRCLLAMEYLRLANLADVPSKATTFNTQKISAACAPMLTRESTGEYWQYAGAGQWSQLTLTALGNNEYAIEVYLIDTGIPPLSENPGSLAVGQLRAVGSFSNDVFFGSFSKDSKTTCRLQASLVNHALEVHASGDENCTYGDGGLAAEGLYYQVNKGRQGMVKPMGYKLNNLPTAKKLAPPAFADVAGSYALLTPIKGKLSVQDECASDRVGVSIDVINNAIHIQYGQERSEWKLTGVQKKSSGEYLLLATTDSERKTQLQLQRLPNGQVRLTGDLGFAGELFATGQRIADYPVVRNCQ
jgi:tetratricopeptide (TPR) repeat protein